MSLLPLAAFAAIILGALLDAGALLGGKPATARIVPWLLGLAATLLAGSSLERSLAIGFPALTGSFESLIFYAAVLCLVAVAYGAQRRLPFHAILRFGAAVVAAALLAVASSPLAPKESLVPIPALRSGWLLLHVATSFIGESFFVLSFLAALAFLLTKDGARRLDYDRIAYTAIALGYPVFSAGALVFGAIWAERAWGTWWSWDPKETWALVTWLVYTFYLHLRLVRRRSDRLVAIVAILGFLATLFTFFGVNYLLPGLHSYN